MGYTVKIKKKHVQMIAHRGLSGLERENTCAAFVAAGNCSYFGIETDIHRTKDGQFVVFHDDTTKRLVDLEWVVEECTMEELRALRLRDMDGNIRGDLVLPTLQEYIRICKKYEKTAVLELKKSFQQKDIVSVVEIVRQEGWLNHTVFISFDLGNMIHLRELLPEQPLQYLVKELTEEVKANLLKYALDLDIKYRSLTADQVEELHRMGRKVNVWTVDDPEIAELLVQKGVDYITTNILE